MKGGKEIKGGAGRVGKVGYAFLKENIYPCIIKMAVLLVFNPIFSLNRIFLV